MDVKSSPSTPPIGLVGSALLFGGAGLLLFGVTRYLIPSLANRTNLEPVLLWFVCAGFGLFVPLMVAALILMHSEHVPLNHDTWRDRFRFRPMTRADWAWSFGGLITIGISAAVCLALLKQMFGEVSLHPTFMKMRPLTPDRYWIFAAWLPFLFVNIMGEEVLWRGVVLPRQQTAFGQWAWLVNGIGWLLFHLPFGPMILITVAPTTLILPYIVQHRQNSWIGVVIHTGLNAPGFIAIALGFV